MKENKIKIKSRDLKWHICTETRFFFLFFRLLRGKFKVLASLTRREETYFIGDQNVNGRMIFSPLDYILGIVIKVVLSLLQMLICCIHTVAALPVCGLLG